MGEHAMRRKGNVIFWICGLIATATFATDENRLNSLLAAAATNRCGAYLGTRAAILANGTNALPLLARCAVGPELTWQQRLVARICYERLVRGAEIEALRAYDWRTDSGYDRGWEKYITGPAIKLGTIVVPKCREIGLWYYYIELNWKDTEEKPVCNKCLKPLEEYTDPRERNTEMLRRQAQRMRSCIHQDGRVQTEWPNWCLSAMDGSPEVYWRRLAISERMLITPFSIWHYDKYNLFVKEKNVEAIPVLVQLYDSSEKIYPSNKADWYRDGFAQIMSFADSRHVDLLEKFISEKPALEPLKKRLAEVRARPAPPLQPEPPFRLGTNTVVIAQ